MQAELPISMDIVKKHSEIPKLIAEMTYVDEEKAIHYMRIWGEGKSPITELHEKLTKEEIK